MEAILVTQRTLVSILKITALPTVATRMLTVQRAWLGAITKKAAETIINRLT